jgi:hypothetical protein
VGAWYDAIITRVTSLRGRADDTVIIDRGQGESSDPVRVVKCLAVIIDECIRTHGIDLALRAHFACSSNRRLGLGLRDTGIDIRSAAVVACCWSAVVVAQRPLPRPVVACYQPRRQLASSHPLCAIVDVCLRGPRHIPPCGCREAASCDQHQRQLCGQPSTTRSEANYERATRGTCSCSAHQRRHQRTSLGASNHKAPKLRTRRVLHVDGWLLARTLRAQA